MAGISPTADLNEGVGVVQTGADLVYWNWAESLAWSDDDLMAWAIETTAVGTIGITQAQPAGSISPT